jgi:hypothetical protein
MPECAQSCASARGLRFGLAIQRAWELLDLGVVIRRVAAGQQALVVRMSTENGMRWAGGRPRVRLRLRCCRSTVAGFGDAEIHNLFQDALERCIGRSHAAVRIIAQCAFGRFE